MSENEKENKTMVEEKDYINPMESSPAYMNRLFCSTKERIIYILKCSAGSLNLGNFDTNSDFFLYTIFGLLPDSRANAQIGLGIYDMLNDPLSAIIIDKMRTRWGKFKPFQYLSLIPSIILGFLTCMQPLIAERFDLDAAGKLVLYMVLAYIGETVNAFFGGGGYIDNVFTPNVNERTSLLVVTKFFTGIKFPALLAGLLIDLVRNNKIKGNLSHMFVGMKTFWWVIATIPAILWVFVSKERVPQSEKPPKIVGGMLSVFRNKPLLIYMLSSFIGGIDVGTPESLYYDSVLKFNLLPTIAGIPGVPLSYASYPIAAKLRKKNSTKVLWIKKNLSVLISESMFFFVGLIGGKKNGFYKKKLPMSIAFAIGNCIEMVYFATGKIIGDEINFEVLDYCEWKNGYRVEATISLFKGYFDKIKGIILTKINALLLQNWAGFKVGVDAVQTDETMWRMFITACGPKLIFDLLGIIPMLFYNIDQKTREKMYSDLERSRAAVAAREKRRTDERLEAENK